MNIVRGISILGVAFVHAEMPAAKEVAERNLRQAQAMAGMQLSSDQAIAARSSHAAVTADAARSNTEDARAQIAETLGQAIHTSKEGIAEQNKAALDVDAAKLLAIRKSLPRDVITNTMQLYAKGQLGIVVSPDGNVIIALIRGLTNIKDRQRNLALLRQYADAKRPEALNFFGYLYDIGLFVQHDARTAESFYRAAATTYAPAMYNLGIGEFYGRFGNRRAGDARRALPYFEQAKTMAMDGSGRICGWASFTNWRIGRHWAHSSQRTGSVRMRLSARSAWGCICGADDAFPALYAFAKAKKPDQAPEFYVIDKYHWNIVKQSPVHLAEEIAKLRGHVGKPEIRDNSAASNAKIQVAKFKQTRDANRMQFNTPVPYLPFRQANAEMFKRMAVAQAPTYGIDLPKLFLHGELMSDVPPLPPDSQVYRDSVAAMKTFTGSDAPIQYYWRVVKMKRQPTCGRVSMIPVQENVALGPFAMGVFLCEDGTPPLMVCPGGKSQLVPPTAKCKGGTPPVFTDEAQAIRKNDIAIVLSAALAWNSAKAEMPASAAQDGTAFADSVTAKVPVATVPTKGFGAFDEPLEHRFPKKNRLNYKGSLGKLGVMAMQRCKNHVPIGNAPYDQECTGVNYMANNCLQTTTTQNKIIGGVANVPTASSHCAGTYGSGAGVFELSAKDQAMISHFGQAAQKVAASTEVCTEVEKIVRPATTEKFNCTKSTHYTEVACTQDLDPQCAIQGGDLASTAVNQGSLSRASITKTDASGVYSYLMAVDYRCNSEASGSISFDVQNIAWGASITLTVSGLDDAAAIGVNGTTVYAGYPNAGPHYYGGFFPTSAKSFQIGYSWTEQVGTSYQQFYANTKLLDYCPSGLLADLAKPV
ncbi:hypothetical protein DFQ30_010818 [Apophysomyces sp. BC1015]|nr:hypothetical protein DFQ30_010818 [Apophysomyces sp. BC1015]